ncbi:MAG: hypothetical protein M3333_08615 [Actinomycetota bacterium]|nr:hypothetical protein [Actinomycetota bacterium]
MTRADDSARPSGGTLLSAAAIVCGMVIGSITIWIASPIFWFWVTGRLQSTQPSMGPYVLLLLGILVTAIVCGKLLGALDRRYARVIGSNVINVHLPWARGLGGEHEKHLRPVTVLDVVMIVSVVVAAIALVTWFIIVKPAPPGLEGSPSKN